MALVIKPSEVDASSGSEVVISNSGLVNSLVQNNQDTLQLLRDQIGPMYMADLSIDTQGRVVIKNKAFTKLMQQKLGAGGGIGAAGGAAVEGWGGFGCVNL